MSNVNANNLDANAIRRLEEASSWLITDATGNLYTDPSYSKFLQRELVRKYKLTSYNAPKINSGNEILRYIIKSRGIYYDILLLKNTEFMNAIYEYWKISITYREWAVKQGKECRFIVTKTSNKTGKRTILKKENQFFHYFDLGNKRVITLDYKNDLKLRYKLLPWYFKDCYKNYPEITEEEVIVLQDGSYTLTPYNK